MTAEALKAAFTRLGWTGKRATGELGVSGPNRVSDWVRGERAVPAYIAASIERAILAAELATRIREAADALDAGADPAGVAKALRGSVASIDP